MAAKKPAPRPAPRATPVRGGTGPDPRPAPVPASFGTTPSGTATAGSPAGNPTLDLAAMNTGGGAGVTGTETTVTGGPGQDDAVYSTGPASAPQLHYDQSTTYAETVAQQMGGAGAGTTTGGSG